MTMVMPFLLMLAIPGGAPPSTEVLRRELLDEKFTEVRRVADLPQDVRQLLAARLGGGDLEMADSDQPFQSTDVILPGAHLPPHRLVVAAVGIRHCILHYESGGVARSRHTLVVSRRPPPPRVAWEVGPRLELSGFRDIVTAIRDRRLFVKDVS